jgi:hypothetical protein
MSSPARSRNQWGVIIKAMRAARLTDGKTIIEIDDEGRLIEYGGDSYKFHRSARDALIIKNLLDVNSELINDAAKAEMKRAEAAAKGE